MNYDTLIQTVSEIVNNELIYTKGLVLVYNLEAEAHRKLSEHFYYKMSGAKNEQYDYTEEFDVEIGNIIIKFVIEK